MTMASNSKPASLQQLRGVTGTGMTGIGMNSAKAAPAVWEVSRGLTDYPAAVARMETVVLQINQQSGPERIWLVEHPALYTAGTSAKADDLIDPAGIPVHKSGRGGEYTYHGPGQRVVYVMLDLKRRREDVRAFVCSLENWIIDALAMFNIKGERRNDRVGVWVSRPEKPRLPDGSLRDDKIAAIGIRLRRWVSFHGVAINVEPQLAHFGGIVPCGVTGHGVTSLADLGLTASMDDLDFALKQSFGKHFGSLA